MTKILLSSPTMHEEEMGFVQEAFTRNWVAPLGFNCDGFEQETAQYLHRAGCEHPLHMLVLNSGTAALHMAMKLVGVKPGEHVFCSDMTFAATVNPAVYEGAVPVFIDSEYESWNMDPEALEKAFDLYPDTRVVIMAHLYGTPGRMDELTDVCRRHHALLVEDAAEALSARYRGKPCGSMGDVGVLSFNGNKIITTSGGGMLVTNTAAEREKALFWATQAREPTPWYQHEEIGYNYRMSNVLAGIGRGQLLHLDEHHARKEAIYRRYEQGLAELPVTMNPYLPDTEPNFWLSCMLIDEGVPVDPMTVLERLKENGIESRPIWKPMHMQPVFKDCGFVSAKAKPVDEDVFSRGLCLPSDIKMTAAEQDLVMAVVKECFDR